MFDSIQRVSKNNPLPRHLQAQTILREMVTSGKLKPGDKIPAELHIAERLGVSKMTVNKAILALTGEGLFIRAVGRGTFVAPPVTKKENGYTRIVLSFPEEATDVLQSDYYGSLCRGVAEFLEKAGPDVRCDLALVSLAARDYVAEEERDPADGRLIIAPRAESIASVEELWRQGKSVIVVGASWPGVQVSSIDSDNFGGASAAIDHLTGLGHQRIALIYAEAETSNTQDRISGYRRALEQAGLPLDSDTEIPALYSWQIGAAARRKLTALFRNAAKPVTAVFAAGHYLALETKNVIREAGLRIPEDVSVVGFDDPLSAQLVYPPLTTVRQPLVEMGRRAAERVLNFIQGREERTLLREVLPTTLMVRRSSGPVSRQQTADSSS